MCKLRYLFLLGKHVTYKNKCHCLLFNFRNKKGETHTRDCIVIGEDKSYLNSYLFYGCPYITVYNVINSS